MVLRFFGDNATYNSLPNTDWAFLDVQTDGAPYRSAFYRQLR